MNELNIDFKKLLTQTAIAHTSKQSPEVASILKAFAKHDIDALTAIAILLDIATILKGESGTNE